MDTLGARAIGNATEALPNPIEDFARTVLENVPVIGGLFSSSKRKLVEAAQREVEKKNLATCDRRGQTS